MIDELREAETGRQQSLFRFRIKLNKFEISDAIKILKNPFYDIKERLLTQTMAS